MAGRKVGRQKNDKDKQQEIQDLKAKAGKPLRFGKMEFYVGARVEALENKHWYAAKVVKVNEKDRKVLIHFEGWNQRYDCWLPIHSPKLKASSKTTIKEACNEDSDRDYSRGDHVLARWANGRHYPAEVMQSVGDGNYEVLFFDGFRKIVSKTNIKIDKKKTYKELENKVGRKQIASSTVTKPTVETTVPNNSDVGGSSRHRKPVAMVDFITPLPRKIKRKSDQDDTTDKSETDGSPPVTEGNKEKNTGRRKRKIATSTEGDSKERKANSTTGESITEQTIGEKCVVVIHDLKSQDETRNDMTILKEKKDLLSKNVPEMVSEEASVALPVARVEVDKTTSPTEEKNQKQSIGATQASASKIEKVSKGGMSSKKVIKKSGVLVSFDWKKKSRKNKHDMSNYDVMENIGTCELGPELSVKQTEPVSYERTGEAGTLEDNCFAKLQTSSPGEKEKISTDTMFTAIRERNTSVRGKRRKRGRIRNRHRVASNSRSQPTKEVVGKTSAGSPNSLSVFDEVHDANDDKMEVDVVTVSEQDEQNGDKVVSEKKGEEETDSKLFESPVNEPKLSLVDDIATGRVQSTDGLSSIDGNSKVEEKSKDVNTVSECPPCIADIKTTETKPDLNSLVREESESTHVKVASSDKIESSKLIKIAMKKKGFRGKPVVGKKKKKRKIWIPSEHRLMEPENDAGVLITPDRTRDDMLITESEKDKSVGFSEGNRDIGESERLKRVIPCDEDAKDGNEPSFVEQSSKLQMSESQPKEDVSQANTNKKKEMDKKDKVSPSIADCTSPGKDKRSAKVSLSSGPKKVKKPSKEIIKIKLASPKKGSKSESQKKRVQGSLSRTDVSVSPTKRKQLFESENTVDRKVALKVKEGVPKSQGDNSKEGVKKVSPLESLSKLVSSQKLEKNGKNVERTSVDEGDADGVESTGKIVPHKVTTSQSYHSVVKDVKIATSENTDSVVVKTKGKTKPDGSGSTGKRAQRISTKGKPTLASMVEQDRPSQVDHSMEEMKRILSKKIEREHPINRESNSRGSEEKAKVSEVNETQNLKQFYSPPPVIGSDASIGPSFRHRTRPSVLPQKETTNIMYMNTANAPPPVMPTPNFNPIIPNRPAMPNTSQEIYMCPCGSQHPVGLMYRCHPPPPPQPCTLVECTDPQCMSYHPSPPPPPYHSSPPPLRLYQPSPPRPMGPVMNPYEPNRHPMNIPVQAPLPQIQDVRSLSTAVSKPLTPQSRVPSNDSDVPVAEEKPHKSVDSQNEESKGESLKDTPVIEDGLSSKCKTQAFQAKKKRLDMITGKLSAQKVVNKEQTMDVPKNRNQRDSPMEASNLEKSSSHVLGSRRNSEPSDPGTPVSPFSGVGHISERDVLVSNNMQVSSTARANVPLSSYAVRPPSTGNVTNLVAQSQGFSGAQPDPALSPNVYVGPPPYQAARYPDPRYVNSPCYAGPRLLTSAVSPPIDTGTINPMPVRHYQPLLPKVPLNPNVTVRPGQYTPPSSLQPGQGCYGRPPPPPYYAAGPFSGHENQQMVGNFQHYPPPRYPVEPVRYYSQMGDVLPPPCSIPGCQCLSARNQQKTTASQIMSTSPSVTTGSKGENDQAQSVKIKQDDSRSPQLGLEPTAEVEGTAKQSRKARKSEKPMPTMVKVPNGQHFEDNMKEKIGQMSSTQGSVPETTAQEDSSRQEDGSKDSSNVKVQLRSTKPPAKDTPVLKRETRQRAVSASFARGGPESENKAFPLYKKSTSKDSGLYCLKSKRTDKEHVLAPKEFVVNLNLNEFKCHVKGCDKSFRKSNLLDYHVKYFHSPRQACAIRKRSSVSISSTDSSPGSALQSPNESIPPKKPKKSHSLEPGEIKPGIEEPLKGGYSSSVSVLTDDNCSDGEKGEDSWEDSTLESDGESDDSDLSDVIRCLCQDDDEQGFMIQCEQCYTWQHGDCVHLSVESVPNKYLCYLCKDPKGLRKSERFKNDYEWYRRGSLPLLSSNIKPDERLDDIILASHGIMGEISNLKDCLHGMKHKAAVLKSIKHPKLKFWMKKKTIAEDDQGDPESTEVDILSDEKPIEPRNIFDRVQEIEPVTSSNENVDKENRIPSDEGKLISSTTSTLTTDCKPEDKNSFTDAKRTEIDVAEIASSDNDATRVSSNVVVSREKSPICDNDDGPITEETIIKPRESFDNASKSDSSDRLYRQDGLDGKEMLTKRSEDISKSTNTVNRNDNSQNTDDNSDTKTPNILRNSRGETSAEDNSTPGPVRQEKSDGNSDRFSPVRKDKEELSEPTEIKPRPSCQKVATDKAAGKKEDSELSDTEETLSDYDEDLIMAQIAVLDDLEHLENQISAKLDELEEGVSVIESEYQLLDDQKVSIVKSKVVKPLKASDLQNLVEKLNKAYRRSSIVH